jgi:hypothetical protein
LTPPRGEEAPGHFWQYLGDRIQKERTGIDELGGQRSRRCDVPIGKRAARQVRRSLHAGTYIGSTLLQWDTQVLRNRLVGHKLAYSNSLARGGYRRRQCRLSGTCTVWALDGNFAAIFPERPSWGWNRPRFRSGVTEARAPEVRLLSFRASRGFSQRPSARPGRVRWGWPLGRGPTDRDRVTCRVGDH